MKKTFLIAVAVVAVLVAAGLYQSHQIAIAPTTEKSDNKNNTNQESGTPNIGNGAASSSTSALGPNETLESMRTQSGLAFGEPEEKSFLWYTAENKTAATINGKSILVTGVSIDEVAAIKQILEKQNFQAVKNNTFNGYGAKIEGYQNSVTACLIESGANLVSRSDNPASANRGENGDIKVYCGRIAANETAKNLPDFTKITNFEACQQGGYPVIAANPRQCVTPETIFLEVETCKAPGGETMTLEEAIRLDESSQCAKEGSMKSNHFCNEGTGTWWIDLQAAKPGCNPACVIDVAKKTAEINWRCTGLKQ